MATSLQDITNAWGNWMNKQYNGGGVKFTASTDYSKHSELDDYHQYQVTTDQQPIVYDPNAPAPVPGSIDSVSTDFNNNSSVAQTYVYEQSETTQQTFRWSVSEDLSIGVEVSVEAGVPEVAKVGSKVTTNLAVSSSQGEDYTNTQTWTVTQPITAPPYTYIQARMVIMTQNYDINWSGTCNLNGYVAIWFNNKIKLSGSNDSHHLYFVKIEKVFSDCQSHNLISLSGYGIGSNCVYAYSSGVFRGGQGVGVTINVNETSLRASQSLAVSAPETNSYTIPIDENGSSAILGVGQSEEVSS